MKESIWNISIRLESEKGHGTRAWVKMPEEFPTEMVLKITNTVIRIIKEYGYGEGNPKGKLISSHIVEEEEELPYNPKYDDEIL